MTTEITLMKMLSRVAVDLGIGEHVYVVGGAVRDFLLGRPVKDVDVVIDTVACGTTSETFAKAVSTVAPGSNLVVNNYGVSILTLGRCTFEGVSLKGLVVEIANARKESYGGAEGKGYKPHMVEPSTIEEDVVRREFRFNTLMWRASTLTEGPEHCEVLDLTGEGVNDLRATPMRMVCPTSPDKTFSDDPTRMLRAIKFGLRFSAVLGDEELAAVRRQAGSLANVPHNAVATILTENIFSVNPVEGLKWLEHLELLPVLKTMLKSEAAFETTLTNWCRTQVFAMLALTNLGGLPLSGGLSRMVDMVELERATRECAGSDETKALAFVEAVRQPGRVMDTQTVAERRGLKGAQMRALMEEARSLLVAKPSFMEGGLTEALL